MRYDIGDGLANDLKGFCKKQLDKGSLELLNKACVKNRDKKEVKLEK